MARRRIGQQAGLIREASESFDEGLGIGAELTDEFLRESHDARDFPCAGEGVRDLFFRKRGDLQAWVGAAALDLQHLGPPEAFQHQVAGAVFQFHMPRDASHAGKRAGWFCVVRG